MNKRDFLKVSGAVLGGLAVGRPLGAAAEESAQSAALTNWAGNLRYGTTNLHECRSVEQVQAFVKANDSFRVLGTRHCFNRIADSDKALVSVRPMDRIIEIDPGEPSRTIEGRVGAEPSRSVVLGERAATVTVEGGTSYGQLCPTLHERGFALHNLASLPHISIAGACATASHGSGVERGSLATAVTALELVTADGEIRKLSAEHDGETFKGAVVGLGALGVVTRLTLKVEPTFQMWQDVYEHMPMAELADNFDEVVSSAYSVSLFTDWRNKNINEVWIKHRLDDPSGQATKAAPEFFGAKLATRNLHPIAALSAENCTAQMGELGPWFDRMPHFKMGFTPSSGDELQAEYFVPHKHAVEAILAIERLHERVSPHLWISEIRTVAEDDHWMSPAQGRPSVTIHFTWKPEWDAVSRLLPIIERELSPFEPRPHWGKLFTLDPKTLQSRYEMLPRFKDLVHEFDPNAKFRNEFLAHNLYG